MSDHDPFRILVVCTGNLVRSALAAQLLSARLAALGSAIRVDSAGAAANAGDAMPEPAQALSRMYGGDPDGHRAQILTAELVGDADLILTAAREHRAQVVSLVPRASRFTFTLKQFARLLDSLDIEDTPERTSSRSIRQVLVGTTEEAAARRGYLPPVADPALDDIDDPYLKAHEDYERAGAAVDAAASTISAVLLSSIERARVRADGA